MNVGFIGTGHMGKHMSRHILEAGYNLVVHDLRKDAALTLIEKGARWVDSPRTMAETCRIVLSSLPGPPEVEEVVYGTNGLIQGWKQGDIYVDMSTNLPTTVRRIAEDARAVGVEVLDAPVSGGEPGADAGTLTIMVGGRADTLENVRKILDTMGSRIFHVGNVGCGNITKLVNNMIALTCSAINSEGFVLGVKAGIDPETLLEVIKVSTGDNRLLQLYPRTVLAGNFNPGFRLSLASKDINLALALGKEYGVPLFVGSTVAQRIIEAEAAGLGEQSSESLVLQLEKLAGVQVRSTKA